MDVSTDSYSSSKNESSFVVRGEFAKNMIKLISSTFEGPKVNSVFKSLKVKDFFTLKYKYSRKYQVSFTNT